MLPLLLPVILTGLLLGSINPAKADPLLSYCLQHLKKIGEPVTKPIERHRQFAQLILLQDQLKTLAQQGNSEALGRCTLALNSALLPYQQRQALPDSLLALQIQLRQLEYSVEQQITLKQSQCRQGLPSKLDLAAQSVWRYLYQAENEHCKQQVWRAYQNRGGDKAKQLLSQHHTELTAYALSLGFLSLSDYQTQHTPLRSSAAIQAFLDSLANTQPKAPWQVTLNNDPIADDPAKLARNSLLKLAQILNLTLKPIDDQQWQVWEQRRFLGTLQLTAGQKHQAQELQSHWIGISPAVTRLSYRQKLWQPHHWINWLALATESFVNMAGAELPYQHAPITGFGTGFGRALARNTQFQQQILDQPITLPPLFSSQALYDAQMALVVSQQPSYNEAKLKQHSDRLFARYFGQQSPPDLTSWRSRSDWAISGARAYLPLWQAEQGRKLVEQLTQGQLSSAELWQILSLAQRGHFSLSATN